MTKKPLTSSGQPQLAPAADQAIDQKLSPVEGIKQQSGYLRGDIATELIDGQRFFGKESIHLLKHHGTYQQDDRDQRMVNRAAGNKEKAFQMMVRTRIPGGKLTSDQLVAELDLCDELGDTTLRFTSRQAIQLHGVFKSNLREVIRRINEVQLTTLGACGDLNRNVMCCPAPYSEPIYREAQRMADQLAAHLSPQTTAYHELWLQDPDQEEKQLVGGGEQGHEVEPIYGARYLPRKFKMGIAFPHDNCIDIHTQDLGLLAIVRHDRIVGYNVLVGGGMGVTPAKQNTFPALAQPLAFVTPDQAIDVVTQVIQVQRDYGSREDRKRARLKYLIHDWGMPKFRDMVQQYYGRPLMSPQPDQVTESKHHLGWEPQGDGQWFYGLNVENGRVQDTDSMRMKSAIREICQSLRPGIRLTSYQSVLFTNLRSDQRASLEAILKNHNVPLSEQQSPLRRWSMACVAWPTCGMAITESERALPPIVNELETELRRLDLDQEAFTVRMTGCPNGCARPYNADIGLVGKAKDRYTIYLGGRRVGTRLAFIYKDLVPRDEIVAELSQVLLQFKRARTEGETLGDFCDRLGKDRLLQLTDNQSKAA